MRIPLLLEVVCLMMDDIPLDQESAQVMTTAGLFSALVPEPLVTTQLCPFG